MKKRISNSFVRKIKNKMEEQNIGIRELARRLVVSHPTVSSFVSRSYQPSFDTCMVLAQWLGQSKIFTLQEAGLLPPGLLDTETRNDWIELLDALSERDIVILKRTAESMMKFGIERR